MLAAKSTKMLMCALGTAAGKPINTTRTPTAHLIDRLSLTPLQMIAISGSVQHPGQPVPEGWFDCQTAAAAVWAQSCSSPASQLLIVAVLHKEVILLLLPLVAAATTVQVWQPHLLLLMKMMGLLFVRMLLLTRAAQRGPLCSASTSLSNSSISCMLSTRVLMSSAGRSSRVFTNNPTLGKISQIP